MQVGHPKEQEGTIEKEGKLCWQQSWNRVSEGQGKTDEDYDIVHETPPLGGYSLPLGFAHVHHWSLGMLSMIGATWSPHPNHVFPAGRVVGC